MNKTKIGFNVHCKTAKQENILQGLKNSSLDYEDYFESVIGNFSTFLNELHPSEYICYEIEHRQSIGNTDVSHAIIYKIECFAGIKKTEIKKHIYDEWNKILDKTGFYE